MSKAIGLRVYKIEIRARGSRTPMSFNSKSLRKPFAEFLEDFLSARTQITIDRLQDRTWYLERLQTNLAGQNDGYVHYGISGFESRITDVKTNKLKYSRRASDTEEIPLYFIASHSPTKNYVLMAFQSFQGRSCIGLILNRLKDDFDSTHDGLILHADKLMPIDAKMNIFGSAPVKQLRLIRRNSPSDAADSYLGVSSQENIDIELVISARRKRSLGNLPAFTKSLKSKGSAVVTYAGIEFPEAIAEVMIGTRRRRISVFGADSDAGVIDLTDDLEYAPSGHPLLTSLREQSTSILNTFHKAVGK